MSAESLGVLLALIVAFSTALAGAVTAWKRAPQDNITTLAARLDNSEARADKADRRTDELEAKVSARDKVIDHMDRWQLAARIHIARLQNTLADNGIVVPAPPADLEITPKGVVRDLT